ncbi:MAG: alpha-amylase family protein [Mogibacterium sp.]|nr:alpha-amylase family protein [Mogibacterium sp.]
MAKRKSLFDTRLEEHIDELRGLYLDIYHDENSFEYFLSMLRRCFKERKATLRAVDERRKANPMIHHSNKMMGMMMYTEKFAGNLQGVKEKLPYLKECGVKYLHLMPLLDSPDDERSDGGYAVSDFRKVRPDLGTMDDLEDLAAACHKRGIRICLDFVMNHTSEDHAWAKAARAGDPAAQNRYFFYDNWDIPNEFEKTMPQVFPETAPGSFTYLGDMNKIVMTSFYPFQWDLNYANPMVFNDMTENMLYLANRGVDIVRLDAVPYIWKQLGTNCRNLPQVHSLVRMMNLACRVVCPSVLLLGEVVMEPKEVVPYFGSSDKPECDMLYNVTTMCTIWHTLATRDVKLLRHQLEVMETLPDHCMFQNYLRCHDDIGWGLDYKYLGWFGVQQTPHKKYLNDWFTGVWPGSPGRGELYNNSEKLADARLCGTTASLCGVESALQSGNEGALEIALAADAMLHACMLTLKGIPVLYSGDEIGMLNDLSYHDDPDKLADSRNLHRGDFRWDLAEQRRDLNTVTGRVFSTITSLMFIRKENQIFHSDAKMYPVIVGDDRVLGIVREYAGQKMLGLFNFSEFHCRTEIETADWHDIALPERAFIPGEGRSMEYWIEPYGFRWFVTETK